jgi:hypothetical protein
VVAGTFLIGPAGELPLDSCGFRWIWVMGPFHDPMNTRAGLGGVIASTPEATAADLPPAVLLCTLRDASLVSDGSASYRVIAALSIRLPARSRIGRAPGLLDYGAAGRSFSADRRSRTSIPRLTSGVPVRRESGRLKGSAPHLRDLRDGRRATATALAELTPPTA